MTPFDLAFSMVIGNEGGYVDNPNDPGGATNWGITERVARENGYQGDMRSMSKADAKTIYKAKYWDRIRGDALPPLLAAQMFDGAVNSGVLTAIKWLQQAVGETVDGQLGPKTLLASHKTDAHLLVMSFDAYRLLYLAKVKHWPTFGRGWANRIANNLLLAAK